MLGGKKAKVKVLGLVSASQRAAHATPKTKKTRAGYSRKKNIARMCYTRSSVACLSAQFSPQTHHLLVVLSVIPLRTQDIPEPITSPVSPNL